MKQNTKVNKAVSKTAREIPIIAWAVEIGGKIYPADVFPTRASARYVRNEVERWGEAQKVHVRKVSLQVIPGR